MGKNIINDAHHRSNSEPVDAQHFTSCCENCSRPLNYSSSSTLPPLQYRTLNGPRFTRLFFLFPGNENDPIRGTLCQTEVDELSIPYTAISYAWLSTDKPHAIECAGKALKVTCSMNSALIRLRRTDHSLIFFADAISINQATDQDALLERAQQVALMGSIFSNAKEVVVDLGEDYPEFQNVLGFCNPPPQTPGSLNWCKPIHYEEALRPLCQRTWFERVWVIQEFVLARNLHFMIGRHKVSTNTIWDFLEMMSNEYFEFKEGALDFNYESFIRRTVRPRGSRMAILMSLRRRYQMDGHTALPLCQLLDQTFQSKATVSHDKVYALLGLLSPKDVNMVHVNYQKTELELAMSISTHLVKDGYGLPMLHLLSSHNLDGKRPSWCIDLNHSRVVQALDRCTNFSQKNILFNGSQDVSFDLKDCVFRACGATTFECEIRNENTLAMQGLILDSVLSCSPIYPDPNGLDENPKSRKSAVVDWYNSAESWAVDLLPRSPGQFEFWSALVAEGRLSQQGSNVEPINEGQLNMRWRAMVEACGYGMAPQWLKISTPKNAVLTEFLKRIDISCSGRRFGGTKEGRLCLVPKDTHPGDMICIFNGDPVPWVLRQGQGFYTLVGSAYVEGVMDGEAFRTSDVEACEIILK